MNDPEDDKPSGTEEEASAPAEKGRAGEVDSSSLVLTSNHPFLLHLLLIIPSSFGPGEADSIQHQEVGTCLRSESTFLTTVTDLGWAMTSVKTMTLVPGEVLSVYWGCYTG